MFCITLDMLLIPVSSSAIAAIGYEAGILGVLFHNTGLYLHPGVPVAVFYGFMAASSKGSYYNRNVRGRYR